MTRIGTPGQSVPGHEVPDLTVPGPEQAPIETLPAPTLSPWDELAIADAAVQLADFGEPVVYWPAGGGSRSIVAVVIRDAAALSDRPRTDLQAVQIQVKNDAAAGISSAEWTNRDRVAVARNWGEAAVQLRVARCIRQDAGMTTLELTT